MLYNYCWLASDYFVTCYISTNTSDFDVLVRMLPRRLMNAVDERLQVSELRLSVYGSSGARPLSLSIGNDAALARRQRRRRRTKRGKI